MAGSPKKRARRTALRASNDQSLPKPLSGVPVNKLPKKGEHRLTRGVYSELIHSQIVEFVRGGCYVETAVRAAGIGKRTFYDWLTKGSKGIEPYATFASDVQQAMGFAESNMVSRIEMASKLDWRAAAWKLERMYSTRYGPKLTVAAEMPVAPDAGMDFSALNVEQLRQLKYLMAKARGELPTEIIIEVGETDDNDSD